MQLKKIKEILKKHENELREKFGIREIMIFGSTVRGEATEKSDVDILAEFEKDISLLGLVKAELYISRLLGIKVDLIPKEDLREELKDRILREAVPI